MTSSPITWCTLGGPNIIGQDRQMIIFFLCGARASGTSEGQCPMCNIAKLCKHVQNFVACTSIRRGNAFTTEVDVQRLRAQRNKQFAWAPHSEVDLKHYCPEGVMVQPGPLFLSTASLKVKCLEVTDLVLRVNGQCLCFFFRYQTSG